MDLAGLKTYLDGLGPTFTLASSDANLPPVLQDLLGTMPGKAIALTPQGAITITGNVLTIAATSTDTWPVTGLGSAKIVLSTAVLTVTDAATPSANATLGGQLPVGAGASAGVTVTPFQGSSTWTVALTGTTGSVTPTELIVLGTGTTLPFTIPPKLDLFTQVATVDPKAFEIRFTPEGGQPAAYRFGVSVNGATWTLIPNVIDFDGMDLAALIGGDGWAVTTIGHLSVGNVPLDIGVQFSNGPVWQAFVQPTTGDTFPGIVDFANWIVSGSGSGTSQGFADIGLNPQAFDLALSRVVLSFDPAKAQVQSLLIASELTIVGLVLDLGLILPDLTLTGTLHDGKPVKVVDMLTSAGLSTASVPQSLTIAEASFSAAPKDGKYSVNVEVDGIWTEGPVTLETIKASVDYAKVTGASSQSPFTGRFEAVIGLGNVAEIDLAAEYAGATAGWTFSGGLLAGTTVKMSDVINELGTTWGIGTVPGPLESLTLTALSVSYQTGTKTFSFNCEGGFTVDKTDVKVVFSIDLAPTQGKSAGDGEIVGTKGYTAKFGGSVSFGGNTFDIVFDTESTGTDIFVADYLRTGDPVALAALIADVSTSIAASIPAGIKIDLQEVKFVFLAQTGKPNLWAFGLRLGTSFALNEIPVIGSKLPPDLTLSVEKLQILYASAVIGDTQAGTINAILPKNVTPLPAAGAGQGIAFEADLTVGSFTKHLQAGVTPPAKIAAALAAPARRRAAAVPAAAGSNTPASGSDPIQWFDLQKQIGVFNFQRVGVGYVNNELEIALDASLAVGPLAFSVDGLTVGSPLTEFKPSFSFNGLSLSFDKPPIDVGGSFLRATDTVNGKDVTSFYGQLNVQVSSFGLKAVGGWTPDTGSFFIYLSIDAPIGGPPALFVTGIAGGLGLNTSLTLPTVDNVGTYILLPGSAPKPADSPRETIANVLTALRDTIHPEVGQYWVAAGISFTSFEMIKARAVISVSFGVETQIGVVGTVAMTFPTGAPNPVAYIEVDILASFTPSTGLLSVDGRINPASNLFAGFVKLSGGFAFYIWFSGPDSGNFVVTLGGYHPAFDKPPIYPVVPRLGMNFALGPFKVIGEAYFALTPGAFMAGIRISATWALGPIKAWFDAGVDFLIAWAPFHYEADASVGIGCSVDLGLFTINIHIGADLYIWGPEFGGRADIDLDVVSFSIEFGAARQAPPPVGWQTFSEKFLPAPSDAPVQQAAMLAAVPGAAPPQKLITNVIRATVEAGKLADGGGTVNWIVDPDAFRILTASTVPANHATWATDPTTDQELPNILADYTRTDPVPALLTPAEGLALRTTPPPPPPPSAPPGMVLILSRDVKTADPPAVWEPDLHIGPMDESDVISTHAIALTKADATGKFTDYVTTFSVEPVLAPSSTALWGKKQQKPTANDKRLIEHTLTGFRISAVPRTPAQVSGIPLLQLMYGQAYSVDYTAETATVDTSSTVTSVIDDDDFTITVTGAISATLPNTDFVLNAIGDTNVAARRATILDNLVANGFATTPSAKINVTLFATATALTDWPRAAVLGAAP
ncbi:DUF6603 domain-containing protein [Mesorhizobium sp. IMUNJ 23232]|uniref:DUF6603 domain-containing protein n=1 Tax=Mesorhizobium sp. IMUNJ 23232 TaxID=3376064 RepID=UPI0037BC2474